MLIWALLRMRLPIEALALFNIYPDSLQSNDTEPYSLFAQKIKNTACNLTRMLYLWDESFPVASEMMESFDNQCPELAFKKLKTFQFLIRVITSIRTFKSCWRYVFQFLIYKNFKQISFTSIGVRNNVLPVMKIKLLTANVNKKLKIQ